MNKVEVTSPNKYAGPYTIKINGQQIDWISDIDLNGLVNDQNEGRRITITLLVNELTVKTEKE